MSAGLFFFLAAVGLAIFAFWPAVAAVCVSFFRGKSDTINVRFDHRVVGCSRRYRP